MHAGRAGLPALPPPALTQHAHAVQGARHKLGGLAPGADAGDAGARALELLAELLGVQLCMGKEVCVVGWGGAGVHARAHAVPPPHPPTHHTNARPSPPRACKKV